MGINGLLPLLKSIINKSHIREFSNMRCGIDASCWLHRGAYTCSMELVNNGEYSTDAYLIYFIQFLDLLLKFKIHPVIVFDGRVNPSKTLIESQRQKRRDDNMQKAKKDPGDKSAYTKALDVTPVMAFRLINELKRLKYPVEFVVAPYEADSQLTHLCVSGYVDFIITEDSDLIPFGAERILYKLDKSTGWGEFIDAKKISACREVDMHHFTSDMILNMCLLSGCDYLESLPGFGIKSAHKIVSRYKTTEKILRGLRFEAAVQMPDNYEQLFYKARYAFLHARIFDMQERKMNYLRPPPADGILVIGGGKSINMNEDPCDFLGPAIEHTMLLDIADGRMDPLTLKIFELPAFSSSSSRLNRENSYKVQEMIETTTTNNNNNDNDIKEQSTSALADIPKLEKSSLLAVSSSFESQSSSSIGLTNIIMRSSGISSSSSMSSTTSATSDMLAFPVVKSKFFKKSYRPIVSYADDQDQSDHDQEDSKVDSSEDNLNSFESSLKRQRISPNVESRIMECISVYSGSQSNEALNVFIYDNNDDEDE